MQCPPSSSVPGSTDVHTALLRRQIIAARSPPAAPLLVAAAAPASDGAAPASGDKMNPHAPASPVLSSSCLHSWLTASLAEPWGPENTSSSTTTSNRQSLSTMSLMSRIDSEEQLNRRRFHDPTLTVFPARGDSAVAAGGTRSRQPRLSCLRSVGAALPGDTMASRGLTPPAGVPDPSRVPPGGAFPSLLATNRASRRTMQSLMRVAVFLAPLARPRVPDSPSALVPGSASMRAISACSRCLGVGPPIFTSTPSSTPSPKATYGLRIPGETLATASHTKPALPSSTTSRSSAERDVSRNLSLSSLAMVRRPLRFAPSTVATAASHGEASADGLEHGAGLALEVLGGVFGGVAAPAPDAAPASAAKSREAARASASRLSCASSASLPRAGSSLSEASAPALARASRATCSSRILAIALSLLLGRVPPGASRR
mmetsp:Transcript_16062/g.60761  ORF Transcript_16062/g.60761 Transcript_16062/m.60761 type:complete len:431 (+) Transcript_16062:1228-2520(+)